MKYLMRAASVSAVIVTAMLALAAPAYAHDAGTTYVPGDSGGRQPNCCGCSCGTTTTTTVPETTTTTEVTTTTVPTTTTSQPVTTTTQAPPTTVSTPPTEVTTTTVIAHQPPVTMYNTTTTKPSVLVSTPPTQLPYTGSPTPLLIAIAVICLALGGWAVRKYGVQRVMGKAASDS